MSNVNNDRRILKMSQKMSQKMKEMKEMMKWMLAKTNQILGLNKS